MNRLVGLALLGLALGGCAAEEGLMGPAAIEAPGSQTLLPVDRQGTVGDSSTLEYTEGLMLISSVKVDCNGLVEYVDEGLTSNTFQSLSAGRHLLITLRREPEFDWPGLYVGATSETLAMDDLEPNRAHTAQIYLDGEEILSGEGGYVFIDAFDENAAGDLDLGVVWGDFEAEVCPVIERELEV
jgi:hypothetical protein